MPFLWSKYSCRNGQPLDYKKVRFPTVSIYTVDSFVNPEHTIGDGKDSILTIHGDLDNKAFERFLSVKVDDKEVPKDGYEAKEGSLILTLKAAYLDTLSAGTHTVTITFDDGSVTASLKVSAAAPTEAPTATPKPMPKTGDSGNPLLWLLIALLGASLLGITIKQYSGK